MSYLSRTKSQSSLTRQNAFLSGSRLHYELLEDRRMLANITVNDDGDVFNLGNSVTTLREAIFQANQNSDFDCIQFDLNDGGPATIQLTSGAIEIKTSLKIEGGYYASNIIEVIAFDPDLSTNFNGNQIFRITHDPVTEPLPPSVEITGLKLTGGDFGTQNNGDGRGGAIFSQGILAIKKSIISGNQATKGGAVFQQMANNGTGDRTVLTVEDSTIEQNSASSYGGALFIDRSASSSLDTTADSVEITRTTISNNHAEGGGGIYAKLIAGSQVSETPSLRNAKSQISIYLPRMVA